MNRTVKYDEVILPHSLNPVFKFILIGNDIDGHVNFDFKEFQDFNELKTELPDILLNLRGEGEWSVSLYQVKENYRLKKKYNHFRIPVYGKQLYEFNYMDDTIRNVSFLKDSVVFFHADVKPINYLDLHLGNELAVLVRRVKVNNVN
jgi:hypothetical protein